MKTVFVYETKASLLMQKFTAAIPNSEFILSDSNSIKSRKIPNIMGNQDSKHRACLAHAKSISAARSQFLHALVANAKSTISFASRGVILYTFES